MSEAPLYTSPAPTSQAFKTLKMQPSSLISTAAPRCMPPRNGLMVSAQSFSKQHPPSVLSSAPTLHVRVQGYLAHKKQQPPRPLQKDYA